MPSTGSRLHTPLTGRRACAAKAAPIGGMPWPTPCSVGGELESFYFEFGEHDVFSIVDLPDDEAAAAVSLIATSAGGATVKTTVLLTPNR